MLIPNTYITHWRVVIIIVSIATALRVYHIDTQSLWIDEVNTMVQAQPDLSFGETYKLLKNDLQPPLYFYLLKYLFRVFGYSTQILRLFSAFLGVVGIFAIYLLGKELHSRKVGVYAAILLCINYFHIYYSQEARPYTFLFLFTTLSFYALVKFIKNQSYRNACYYGVFSCLMLYGHPFGIFSLFAQFILLAFVFFQTSKAGRLLFFKQLTVALLLLGLFYLPAVPLFLTAAGIKSFWIPKPDLKLYSILFGDFFGNSEALIVIAYLMILLFLFRVFNSKDESSFEAGIIGNRLSAQFVILITWIVFGIIIPLVRSYLQVPMIVSRYMIGLLPAVILLVSLGIYQVNNKTVRNFILGLIVLFSLIDLFIVKDYYNKIIKSQLREVAQGVKENYVRNTPIVSNLWWHYSYFLDSRIYEMRTIDPVFFIDEMMAHPERKVPFWYINGHNFALETLSPDEASFLKNNFYVARKFNFYDAWAVYYVPKKQHRFIFDLNEFKPFKVNNESYIYLYGLSSTHSPEITLNKGHYTLYLEGRSEPEVPVNSVNAHITVKMNGRVIGGTFLYGKKHTRISKINFTLNKTEQISLELIFDNDIMLNNKDRNARIYFLYIDYQGDIVK